MLPSSVSTALIIIAIFIITNTTRRFGEGFAVQLEVLQLCQVRLGLVFRERDALFFRQLLKFFTRRPLANAPTFIKIFFSVYIVI